MTVSKMIVLIMQSRQKGFGPLDLTQSLLVYLLVLFTIPLLINRLFIADCREKIQYNELWQHKKC